MVNHTQNYLSVFDHFMGLTLKEELRFTFSYTKLKENDLVLN